MNLLAAALLFSSLFSTSVDRAFVSARSQQWPQAAAALDQADAADPALYIANSLPYLRGRIAETVTDWKRAQTEFARIPESSSLHALALWHEARAAIHQGNESAAVDLIRQLPSNFSSDLKMQLARESSPVFAMTIYATLSTRDARFQYAKAQNDRTALWALIRERKDDDAALSAAQVLGPSVTSAKEATDIADVFVVHREFDYALPLYRQAAQDPSEAADSRFQIARIYFLRDNYRDALTAFQALASDFAGTDSEKDAIYQVASCYWRLGDFVNAEKTYLRYIDSYGKDDNAIRNLIDVYRGLGNNGKALEWTNRALATKISTASRQAFIFTKAKILYTQKRYAAALLIFRQLERGTIRSAPGGSSKEEVRYFEALCLSKSGNAAAAKIIWKELATDPLTYYGTKAMEKLGVAPAASPTTICTTTVDTIMTHALNDLIARRRPLRTDAQSPTNAVSELEYLELWDEASAQLDGNVKRGDYQTAAELAYAAERYYRSIAYADRLPRSDAGAIGLRYPAGFRQLICEAAVKYSVDPLWLHAIIWQESRYNPAAHSAAAARGLMQFIPETANAIGATIGMPELSPDRLYDPRTSIELGARYWANLLAEFKTPEMALAAYNGGPDNVRRWKAKSPAGDNDMFVADVGFIETKRYVMAVYTAWNAYRSLK